jgi:hypothetical protein
MPTVRGGGTPSGTRVITPVSGNLTTTGGTGSFETVASGWGIGLTDPHTVSRSSTQKKDGTYSAKVQPVSTYFFDQILNVSEHPIYSYGYFKATCWIYIPSTTPWVTGGNPFYYLTRSGGGTSVIDVGGVWQSAALDTWVQLSLLYQSSVDTSETCTVSLFVQDAGSGGGGVGVPVADGGVINTTNGIIYVDQVEVYKVDVQYVNYQFANVITAASGPTANDGVIQINVSPAGAYQYSIDNGVSYSGSNSFSSLYPGAYNIVVNDGGGNYLRTSITVGVIGARYTIQTALTNEDPEGSANGTITLTVGPQSDGSAAVGSPFTYQIISVFGSTTNGTGIFTGLAKGLYTCYIFDTYGNSNAVNLYVDSVAAPPKCGILFDQSKIFITEASSIVTADGAIQVNSYDSIVGGTVYYNLGADFTVPSSNTTGTFTGLLPGTYTVYARTTAACGANLTVVVGYAETYGPLYRLDFDQIRVDSFYDKSGFQPSYGANNQFRFEIQQRDYAGAVSIIKGDGEDPIQYSWRGEGTENPFDLKLVSLDIQVNLLAETNEQFSELFTQDETLYKGVLYIYNVYTSAYEIIVQGFGTSMLFDQQYSTSTNYPVGFRVTDRLADLSGITWSDFDGNEPTGRISVLAAILYCLSKTNLKMDLRDKVNTYAPGMSITYSDGSLIQRFIDTRVYQNSDGTFKTCREVLDGLLTGLSLYQADGVWNVETVSEKCTSNTPYQQYDYKGNFVSSNVEQNKMLIRRATAQSPKLTFSDYSVTKKVAETYGKVKVTYDLGIEAENNLLTYGKFEAVDLVNGQIKGWAVDFADPIELVLEKSPAREISDTCLSIRFDPYTASDPVTLSADNVAMFGTNGTNYRLKLSFDVYTRPVYTNTYIFLDYRLRLVSNTVGDDFYLQHAPDFNSGLPGFLADTSSLMTDGWIRLYIDQHLQWKTVSIETLVNIVAVGQDLDGILQLDLRIDGNPIADCADFATLRAVASTNYHIRNIDNRRRVTSGGFTNFYTLQPGTEAESLPDVVRPTDFTDHVWKLDKIVDSDGVLELWAQHVLIDNVKVEYLPQEIDPITSIVKEEVINENISTTLEVSVKHGDIYYSSSLILTDEIDPNYEKLMLNYYTLANGSATYGGWFRRNVIESKFYHELISKMVRSQFSIPRWKLVGSFSSFEQLPSYANIFHELRSGRVFMPLALTVHPRQAMTEFELRESVKGVVIDDVGTPDIPPIEPVDTPESNFQEHSDQHSDQHD